MIFLGSFFYSKNVKSKEIGQKINFFISNPPARQAFVKIKFTSQNNPNSKHKIV